jgi:hypothetical protein
MKSMTKTRGLCLAIALATVLGTAATGCKADAPSLGDADAGASTTDDKLPAPTANGPESTSHGSVAIRGSAPGTSQVVVQGEGAITAVARVLPDGTFCVDVPLVDGSNSLQVVSLAQGAMSAPKEVKVVHDASAAAPSPPTCSGASTTGPSCTGTEAMCNPACNGCKEDVYQPNFLPAQAPALLMKSHLADLRLCPCRSDWFTFVAYAGQSVSITANYAKVTGFDIDMAVFHTADALAATSSSGPSGAAVATAVAGTSGSDTTRTVTFSAPRGGSYTVRIASSGASGSGAYALTTK